MPIKTHHRLDDVAAKDPRPNGARVSSSAKAGRKRPCYDFFGKALFAALIFLIIVLLPLGWLYDLLRKHGLQHSERGMGSF